MRIYNLVLFVVLLLLPVVVIAQEQPTTPQTTAAPDAPKSLVDGKIQINSPNVPNVSASNWGHEVGTAVSESLKAIRQEVPEMADTNIGKLATFLVVWKVVGKDFLGLGYTLYVKFIVLVIYPIFMVLLWKKIGSKVLTRMLNFPKEELVESSYSGEMTLPNRDITIGLITLLCGILLILIWLIKLF